MAAVVKTVRVGSGSHDFSEGRLRSHHSHSYDFSEGRARLRTCSSIGMPVSPWALGPPQPGDGIAAQIARAHHQDYVPVMASAWPGLPGYIPTTGMPMQVPSPYQQPLSLSSAVHYTTSVVPHAGRSVLSSPPGVFNNLQRSSAPGLSVAPSSTRTTSLPTAAPSGSYSLSSSEKTTVMLRNLPEGFSRAELISVLDSKGFKGRYDFVYLPFNFDHGANLRHAFVNMVTAADAKSLWKELDGFCSWATPSDSVCGVAWNDKQQGLPALIDRYRNSPVLHEKVPDEYKPRIFSTGEEMAFPPPTQEIKSPKMRKKA